VFAFADHGVRPPRNRCQSDITMTSSLSILEVEAGNWRSAASWKLESRLRFRITLQKVRRSEDNIGLSKAETLASFSPGLPRNGAA
jgi:hypothetical protein